MPIEKMTKNEPSAPRETGAADQRVTIETIGRELHAKRLSLGKSIEEVAMDTRLSASVIEAIESGNPRRLPPPAFAKGFIRIYAECINLDSVFIENLTLPYENQTSKKLIHESANGKKVLTGEALAVAPISITSRMILSIILVVLIGILANQTYRTFINPLPPESQDSQDLSKKTTPDSLPAPSTAAEAAISEKPALLGKNQIESLVEEPTDSAAQKKIVPDMPPEREPPKPAIISESPVITDDGSKPAVLEAKTEAHPEIDPLPKTPPTPISPGPKAEVLPAEEIQETSIPSQLPEPIEKPESSLSTAQADVPAYPMEAGAAIQTEPPEESSDSAQHHEEVQPIPPSINYLLKIIASKKVIMTIAIDGRNLRKFVFLPGEQRIWKAQNKIELHVDNPQGIKIIVNNRVLPISGSNMPMRIIIPDHLDHFTD